MADLGFVSQELNALPANLRPVFLRIFQAVLKDLRMGHPTGEQPNPSTNFGAGFFDATTPSGADDEFTIAHTFGRTPYLAIPVLPLDAVGSKIVPLTVTRAADDKRIYLSSSETSAPITLFIEG
jgi:hypothetical protein